MGVLNLSMRFFSRHRHPPPPPPPILSYSFFPFEFFIIALYFAEPRWTIENLGAGRKLFADDIELYRALQPHTPLALGALRAVQECCQAIKAWITSNKLEMTGAGK